MSPARQVLALAAIGLVAAVVGFAGASALSGHGDAPTGSAATAQPPAAPQPAPAIEGTAAAEPAVPPEAPSPPPATPATTAADPVVAETPPVEPSAPARTTAPATTARAVPDPPAPVTAPAPAATTPSPPPLPARVLETPADPPTGVAITEATALRGVDAAHRILATAYATATAGSTEHADLARALALWRAYLAPGAPPAPAGRRATIARAVRADAWWFRDRAAPRSRVLLRDEDGVILTYRAGQGFAVNPVATTGRWRGLNDDVPAAGLATALMEMGVARTASGRGFLAWEYYDVEGDPDAIVPGVSGMAQARVALTMAHARADTGDPRFAAAALEALRAFTVDVDRGGARSMVRTDPAEAPAPWYVERAYPGEDPWKGGALNGFMVTLLNLRGTAQILSSASDADGPASQAAALARDLADRGALTLQRHLPDHDTGTWSLYGLLTPGRPWRTYLADLNYHCYHVRLLAQLAEAYPDLGFAETSDRWQGYVDAVGATCPARPA